MKMRTKLLALLVAVGSSAFAGPRFFFGVGVGPAYVPAPVYVAPAYVAPAYLAPAPVVMARPAPVWIPGYYYPVGPRFVWHAGYWGRPPFAGAFWVGPRYYGGHFYGGYWRR
jgi:hypothetical protein